MLLRVIAVALNTYRESVRARILLGLAGVAFAVAFYSLVVGAYTLKYQARVVSDLGAASISLFSIAVAIVIGATSLHRELEQKTLFPILARPIRRGEYLAGKYLGTLLTIAVFIMADAGLVLLISAALGGRPFALVLAGVLGPVIPFGAVAWRWSSARTFILIPWALGLLVVGALLCGVAPDERRVVLGASLLAFLEVSIIAAFATLFSSFSTPFLSALLTIGIVLIGRNTDALARFPVKTMGQGMHDAGVFLSKIAPNLHVYVAPRPLLTGEALDTRLSSYLAMAAVAALGWSIGLLTVASVIFKKRDFL
jgi:ABC-type transport system involved in multi-copper enzyme maturation permease subunit